MNKIWMMGSVAAVATVAAMVWGAPPARSSQDWLAKAQSEFATKARDAVIQRRIGQGMSQNMNQDQGVAQNPVMVAVATPADQLAPVAAEPAPAPPATVTQEPAAAPVVESTKELPVAPAASEAVSSPTEVVPMSQPVELSVDTPARREGAADPAVAESEVRHVAASKPAEVAPPVQAEAAPLQAEPVIKRAARPSVAETQPREVASKNRHVAKQTAPVRASRRSGSDNSVEAQGMRALRQHAPEIAAMIGRYM
jgi:hypothetical protein